MVGEWSGGYSLCCLHEGQLLEVSASLLYKLDLNSSHFQRNEFYILYQAFPFLGIPLCSSINEKLQLIFKEIIGFRDPFSGDDVKSSAFCAMIDVPPYLYEFSSIVFFVVPMISLVVMYAIMGWKMVVNSRRRQSLMTSDMSSGRDKTKRAVLKMLGKS